mmetsp:Transcript_1678/g.2586  ORF Transcript_1678/g.2586 Transcript_1678/m.2586 type:complete len:201 (+) Transcript_1678:22-624(+)
MGYCTVCYCIFMSLPVKNTAQFVSFNSSKQIVMEVQGDNCNTPLRTGFHYSKTQCNKDTAHWSNERAAHEVPRQGWHSYKSMFVLFLLLRIPAFLSSLSFAACSVWILLALPAKCSTPKATSEYASTLENFRAHSIIWLEKASISLVLKFLRLEETLPGEPGGRSFLFFGDLFLAAILLLVSPVLRDFAASSFLSCARMS